MYTVVFSENVVTSYSPQDLLYDSVETCFEVRVP